MNLEYIIKKAIEDKVATGIAVGIVKKDGKVNEFVYGKTEEGGANITRDTLFDLASLTKVVFTTPYILRLIEEGEISLNDPLNLFIEGFEDEITIKNLLTHTSGLKSWLPLFSSDINLTNEVPYEVNTISKENAIEKILKYGIESHPNAKVEYSDLGFILLGFVIEKVVERPLRDVAKEFLNSLGMEKTSYEASGMVCATEEVGGKHLVGVVHDENARSLGGVSGHAGLFSNLKDLEKYALIILNEGTYDSNKFFLRESIRLIQETATNELKPERTIGFVKGRYLSTAPDFAPFDSIGHTGFTGTSIYFDFEKGISIIILTNRVYYGRKNTKHMHFRRVIGNLIYKELL